MECVCKSLLACPLLGGLSSFGVSSNYWTFHCITVNSGELQILYPIPFSVHRKFIVCFCHRPQYKTIELYQPYISHRANRNGIQNSKFS